MVFVSSYKVPDKEDTTKNSKRNQPCHMMDEKCQIQSIFLSIVISNEIDWLKVLLELTAQWKHREEQFGLVSLDTVNDFVFLLGVQHEMLLDHTTINQSLRIELLLKDWLYQPNLLGSSESLVLRPSCISELNVLILILQLDDQLLIFSRLIEDVITEVDKHNLRIFWILGVFESLPF